MKQVSELRYRWRKATNLVAMTLSWMTAGTGLISLAWILWTLVRRGLPGVHMDLFFRMTPPPMQPGGIANALYGSAMMCGLAILVGAPIGIAAGTWLSEFGRRAAIGAWVRFVNDILLSAPSIILGLFVYTLYVRQAGGHFSALAGGLSLALIVIPIIVRTTDEMLSLIPSQMREAALSLGIPQWKMTVSILYRSASSGILTGLLLAFARIIGETAPLLFTAFGNQYWNSQLRQPMAAVPLVMNQFAASPYHSWQTMAWAGALVLATVVLVISISARILISRKKISSNSG